MIGTVTLNPSIDQHWVVDNLVKDDTNRARIVTETPGGKGINVSKVIRELGGKTKAFALLGGFTGGRVKELAHELDFPMIEIRIAGQTRINMVITDVEDKTQTRVSAPGPHVQKSELEKLLKHLKTCQGQYRFWAFGGSLPQGLAPSVYREMIERLQKCGTPCVLDTDNEALKQGVLAKPFMIKPNEYEMERLCGKRLRSISDYLREARHLVRTGIHLVVVSLGPRGALFVTAQEAFQINAPAVNVKSKVGAGDSLIGGVLWGLAHQKSMVESAKLGVAASSSAVMREAPRLCLKKDMPGLLRRLRVKPL